MFKIPRFIAGYATKPPLIRRLLLDGNFNVDRADAYVLFNRIKQRPDKSFLSFDLTPRHHIYLNHCVGIRTPTGIVEVFPVEWNEPMDAFIFGQLISYPTGRCVRLSSPSKQLLPGHALQVHNISAATRVLQNKR